MLPETTTRAIQRPDLAAARQRLYANRDRNAAEHTSLAARLPRDGRYARYPQSSNPVMVALAYARRTWKHEEVLARWRERGAVPTEQEGRQAA